MGSVWKVLIGINTVVSCLALLYLYGLLSINPYDRTHYEIEQLKRDIRNLEIQTNELKEKIEASK